VEIKEGYKYLNNIKAIDMKIQRLKCSIAEMRLCAIPSQTTSGERVQSTRKGSAVERLAERILELEEELDEALEQKAKQLIEIEGTLDTLKEGPEKAILYGFYIAGLPMGKISEQVGYSIKHCYKLRRRGIEMLPGKICDK
jgi:DNA-directed RNA polymerase specialized sigma24 family protein